MGTESDSTMGDIMKRTYLEGLLDALKIAARPTTTLLYLTHDCESAYAYGKIEAAQGIRDLINETLHQGLLDPEDTDSTIPRNDEPCQQSVTMGTENFIEGPLGPGSFIIAQGWEMESFPGESESQRNNYSQGGHCY